MTTTHSVPMIVHRMAALDGPPFPPNSLEAIHACLEAGAAFVEICRADGEMLAVTTPIFLGNPVDWR